jgi:hypothetical protein
MASRDAKDIRTSTLFRRLFKATDLTGFIKDNAGVLDSLSFRDYITELCGSMGLVSERVIKQSLIDRTYGHQLFNGTRNPSRDKVIQLAFGFGLDVDGTQALLKTAQKNPLYPKIKRDAALLYCLNHRKSIIDTQNMLLDLDLNLLGGE